MDVSEKFATAILKSYAEKDFAEVHALIPKYANHLFCKVRDGDTSIDFLRYLNRFFSDIEPMMRFDLLANWMILAKQTGNYDEQANHVNAAAFVILAQSGIDLAQKMAIGSYFRGKSLEFNSESFIAKNSFRPKYPDYPRDAVRLRNEDIVIRAVSINQPFDEYTKFILSQMPDKNALYASTFINESIKHQNVDALLYFLGHGADIYAADVFENKHNDAFMKAILVDHDNRKAYEILDILLQNGLSIDRYGKDCLLDVQNVDAMRWLIDQGHKVDDELLFNAVSKQYYAIAKFILQEHADKININFQNRYGETFPHILMRQKKIDIALFSLFLEKGFDYTLRNNACESVLTIIKNYDTPDHRKCREHLDALKELRTLNKQIQGDSDINNDVTLIF